ncbi:winged helix-turn-helix domain-containing protein [Alteromonas sp. CYL-A6]|uniref:winged helix-turn-helix domain-containing protein n=1 Tax=Alteromonas nitratireducens TaxID=3390813 RepID=UPI0034AB3DA2
MKTVSHNMLRLNNWEINILTGELSDTDGSGTSESEERIDPQGIKLLQLLAEKKAELVTKETLMASVWPDTIVTEDALSRCVSRVRKQLGDDARNPEFIETLPKRGYRLIAEAVEWTPTPASSEATKGQESQKKDPLIRVTPASLRLLLLSSVLLIGAVIFSIYADNPNDTDSMLVRQADDYYHRINRSANEMAVELYQQAIALDPESAEATSGLANALVQRVIRLPAADSDTSWEAMSLRQALGDGRTGSTAAIAQLKKAENLALKSIQLEPDNARTYKAYGFVLSAQNKLEQAKNAYLQALEINPAAWDVLINLGEISDISGQSTDAITYYKKALHVMHSGVTEQSNRGRPWRAGIGSAIGNKYLEQNNVNEAEIWFRHVLSFAPFDNEATVGLSIVLINTGRKGEAERLCQAYQERVGIAVCDS